MLSEKGVEPEERDFFQDRLSEDELRRLLGDRSPTEFFSWNSPSFKKLGVNREELNDEQLISLMVGEPRLIRRPLIQVGNDLLIGTDRKAMAKAFPEG